MHGPVRGMNTVDVELLEGPLDGQWLRITVIQASMPRLLVPGSCDLAPINPDTSLHEYRKDSWGAYRYHDTVLRRDVI